MFFFQWDWAENKKVNLSEHGTHPELYSFKTITTPPVALCIRLPFCSVARRFSHRQKRIILSQQYLGTLKAPYSLLDWHVWPGGLIVTCLVSRHPMMSGEKMRTYAAFLSNDWVCRKPLFHLAAFLVALRWKARACTECYGNCDKWCEFGGGIATDVMWECHSDIHKQIVFFFLLNTWMNDIHWRLVQYI